MSPDLTGPGEPVARRSAMKDKVVRATLWAAVENGGAQAAAFLFFVVFARLLSPGEFGVYALAMAVVGACNMVLFQGFGDGLIQSGRTDEEATSTAFWINMGLAAGIVAVLQVAAPLAGAMFHEPQLGPVIGWLSLLCLPRGLVSIHSALFRRTLDLRIFAIRTVLGSVAGGLVGVALALAGCGIWALVVSQFVQSVLVAAIMWRSIAWRPRFLFSVPVFRRLFAFSRHFMAASVISSCIDDIGSMLVGLTVDVGAVGYYAVALRVIRALVILIQTPLQLVMMPALRGLADDPPRFGAAYRDMVLVVSTVWLPSTLGLAVTAPPLVTVVFGPRWAEAAPVLQAMAFGALMMPLWVFSGQALSAVGRSDAFARSAYWQLGFYCVAFPIAARFGVVAAGWAWTAVAALMVPVSLRLLHRCIGFDPAPLLGGSARIAVCGGVMMAATLSVRAALPTGLWALALAGAVGMAAYLAAMELLVLPGHLARLFGLIRSVLRLGSRSVRHEVVR